MFIEAGERDQIHSVTTLSASMGSSGKLRTVGSQCRTRMTNSVGSQNLGQPSSFLIHLEEPGFVLDAKLLAPTCALPLCVLYCRLGICRCLHVLVLDRFRELGP